MAIDETTKPASDLDDFLEILRASVKAADAEGANSVLVPVDAVKSVVDLFPLLRRITASVRRDLEAAQIKLENTQLELERARREIQAYEFERGETPSFEM